MTKPSYEELKFELAYIAISPAQENGGFHPRVVKAAKDALFEIERVRGLLQRAIDCLRDHTKDHACWPEDNCERCLLIEQVEMES